MWLQRIKEKLYRFMQGRNGIDELSKTLNTIAIVLFLVSAFTRWMILYYIAMGLMIYSYFRIFSKNIPKRYEENQKFCAWRYDMAIQKNKRKKEWEQRKIYRFFRCPMCKQKVRVPKGRGKICITCPKCREEFVRRS